MIEHDRLFKELISTFFVEFLELFFPQVLAYIEPDSISFLDKELFTDVTSGEQYEADLIAKVRFSGKEAFFLIHVENQAHPQRNFGQRMFRYFARLSEKFALPVYPVVIFSFDAPRTEQPHLYQVEFPDKIVLQFNYGVIQLNRLNWRDFLQQPNPVASALMAKMKIKPSDRPKVKVECLRLLVTLKLDRARMQLISGFVDTYLRLNAAEEKIFQQEISQIKSQEQEEVMQIVTSWMETGIQQGLERGIKQGIIQGLEQGKREGEIRLVMRLLNRHFGSLDESLSQQIYRLSLSQLESLTDIFLDLENIRDLRDWLNQQESSLKEDESGLN